MTIAKYGYGLTGKVCLVTGGGAGIGRAIAMVLARAGAFVAVADIIEERAHAVAGEVAEMGGRSVAFGGDISDPAVADGIVAEIVSRFGAIDVGVNNAGISSPGKRISDCTVEEWRRVMEVNLDGVFYCLRAEIRALLDLGRAGSLINMASVLGQVGLVRGSAYVAAKHGVVGLTKAAALDHARDNIRVNAVGPGFVETQLVRETVDSKDLARLIHAHPIGRLGRPEEVAELVAWLASDASSFCTGGFYSVDGGYSAA